MLDYYFNDLKKKRKLSNEETVACIREGRRKEAIDGNLRLVIYVIRRESYPVTEDNIQFGNWGLCEAVDGYDISKNIKFVSYAYAVIHSKLKRFANRSKSLIAIPYTKMENGVTNEDIERCKHVVSLDRRVKRESKDSAPTTIMDLQKSDFDVVEEADRRFIFSALYNLIKNHEDEVANPRKKKNRKTVSLLDIYLHKFLVGKSPYQTSNDLGITKQAVFQRIKALEAVVSNAIRGDYKYGLMEV